MNQNILYSHTASRAEQDANFRIRTHSGRLVNPFALTVDDIDIKDIAFHCSNETRYAGAVGFYSVGQHSLEVMWEAMRCGEQDPAFLLSCLLHDAEEAYLKDIPSPVKSQPAMAGYRDAAIAARRMIFEAFGLDWDSVAARVKQYDHAVYFRERRSFDHMLNPEDAPIIPWPPGSSAPMFIDWFNKLRYKIMERTHVAA